MSAIYRGERVKVLRWNPARTKAKIATRSGVRWAQARELELIP